MKGCPALAFGGSAADGKMRMRLRPGPFSPFGTGDGQGLPWIFRKERRRDGRCARPIFPDIKLKTVPAWKDRPIYCKIREERLNLNHSGRDERRDR
ncbi:MAG: hypothetical protein C6P37_14065 [Caldibacillus debilis]|uniref:Uncharacterized protein n=1 Tax=Caldibacillus debilis TaxID=301148 RepID=A0A3E0K123_9BACI|nr:MAG: hypothetical protein C6P37_14065 [Caldibacillus debilis]